ncbi:hypothetical protein KUTeg_021972 [Tegillarca granosa]|uniref:Guanine nucleotide exchange factor VAV2 n=1 Tax=Tegillarca granosa TaxID=220873 RepID=A0ABQ9E4W8_TEGGR|nr:hypothetical protein KUTeg_021972 [Tegillarca granosa]
MRKVSKMASDEWRMCVDWLVQCRILPEDHRATRPESEAFDLAQALRDGVLICHLLNNISPGIVDAKDFSARPQLSQFLCLKNIRTFLQTCKREFGLRDHDLFDPPDLFDVKDFRKVLHTLSKLSKTEIAQSKFSALFNCYSNGFPPDNTSTSRGRHHDDDEDIYGNLPDMALENDLDDNEEIYDRVYHEEDEEIYEDLCSTRRSKRVSGTPTASELPSPVTKKDHCIKELYDTEKNYVDALKMLVQHFIKPLKDVIPQQERDIIFAHIEKLLEVHKSFLTEIQLACVTGSIKLYDVFVKYKTKLLIYGDYCSNLPLAQEKIDEVLKKGEAIKLQIEACEKRANEGKFKLRDLLHVPMQRVLKYHLLLKELLKSSEKQSEEHKGLEMALEAMQFSIGDLQMPPNTSLKDYGRLQKDGELKVKNHTDNRLRSRYIFLFDKVMLMCKSKGETYNFKEAIILSEYKVHDGAALKELQKKVDKWNCAFIMAKKNDKNAYTFYAKTDDMRSKWIEAIRLALENTEIPAGTNYVMHTFEKPTECNVCGKLLRGVFFQGYQCQGKENINCIKTTMANFSLKVNL